MSDEGLGSYIHGLASRAVTPDGIQRNGYFGKQPIKQWANTLAAGAMRRNALLERLSGEPYLGFRMPLAADCAFTLDFAHFDTIRRCCAEHVTASGARFRVGANKDVRWLLASERLRLDHELKVAALRFMQAAIKAHNDVVRPIDNGPDTPVYLVETCYRLREAIKAVAPDHPEAMEELKAASRAHQYAIDEATAYFSSFNHEE